MPLNIIRIEDSIYIPLKNENLAYMHINNLYYLNLYKLFLQV